MRFSRLFGCQGGKNRAPEQPSAILMPKGPSERSSCCLEVELTDDGSRKIPGVQLNLSPARCGGNRQLIVISIFSEQHPPACGSAACTAQPAPAQTGAEALQSTRGLAEAPLRRLCGAGSFCCRSPVAFREARMLEPPRCWNPLALTAKLRTSAPFRLPVHLQGEVRRRRGLEPLQQALVV